MVYSFEMCKECEEHNSFGGPPITKEDALAIAQEQGGGPYFFLDPSPYPNQKRKVKDQKIPSGDYDLLQG